MLELLPAGRRRLSLITHWEATTCGGLVRLEADDDCIQLVRDLAETLRRRLIAPD